MTLCAGQGMQIVMPALKGKKQWVEAVHGELRRLRIKNPPNHLASRAFKEATYHLGPHLFGEPHETQPILDLRLRIAGGIGNGNEHLGEAQSIVIGLRVGSAFVSDDTAARAEGFAEGLDCVSVCGLLAILVNMNRLGASDATTILNAAVTKGRGQAGLGLNLRDLYQAGHIQMH
jgi:hypothetical protein